MAISTLPTQSSSLSQTAGSQESSGLKLEALEKSFGAVQALKGVDLEIRKGEFFTLLGPSGCGKTTLLRIIAGFELPDSGRVLLHGKDLTPLAANQRPVNTVFQSYALFPHLSVFENVAFGLRSKGIPSSEIKTRVSEALGMMRLESFASRHPHQLSGGQRQRVALARALVNQPDVLLLDEPMSALDAKLRAEVQVELRQLQRRLGTTFILVTHDQDEAMSVSDRIAVIHSGKVGQLGSPEEVYNAPKTRFVAEFLGAANLIPASGNGASNSLVVSTQLGTLTLERPALWKSGILAIRTENILLSHTQPSINGVRCRINDIIYRGSHLEVFLEPGTSEQSPEYAAFNSNTAHLGLRVRHAPDPTLRVGQELWAQLPPAYLVALEPDATDPVVNPFEAQP